MRSRTPLLAPLAFILLAKTPLAEGKSFRKPSKHAHAEEQSLAAFWHAFSQSVTESHLPQCSVVQDNLYQSEYPSGKDGFFPELRTFLKEIEDNKALVGKKINGNAEESGAYQSWIVNGDDYYSWNGDTRKYSEHLKTRFGEEASLQPLSVFDKYMITIWTSQHIHSYELIFQEQQKASVALSEEAMLPGVATFLRYFYKTLEKMPNARPDVLLYSGFPAPASESEAARKEIFKQKDGVWTLPEFFATTESTVCDHRIAKMFATDPDTEHFNGGSRGGCMTTIDAAGADFASVGCGAENRQTFSRDEIIANLRKRTQIVPKVGDWAHPVNSAHSKSQACMRGFPTKVMLTDAGGADQTFLGTALEGGDKLVSHDRQAPHKRTDVPDFEDLERIIRNGEFKLAFQRSPKSYIAIVHNANTGKRLLTTTEHEVLFRPGSQFRVVKPLETHSVGTLKGYDVVELEEVV